MSAKEKRVYRDRRDYLIAAVKKRRTKVRKLAVELKGGKCELCGYDRCLEALEFHHLSTDDKDFGISDRGYTRSWEKIVSEIDKCALLCSNCHRQVHLGIAKLSGQE
jgi:5-methylcytosine-specific restriction endonuclease McrA